MSEPSLPDAAAAAAQVDDRAQPAQDLPAQGLPAHGLAADGPADGLPDEAAMRRAEEKPPLYRYVRGSVYAAYMLVVVWFVVGVVLAAYNAVWGPEGAALQAQEQQQPLKTPEKSR